MFLRTRTSFKQHSTFFSSCAGSFWLVEVHVHKDGPWWIMNFCNQPSDVENRGSCGLTRCLALIFTSSLETGRRTSHLMRIHLAILSWTSVRYNSNRPLQTRIWTSLIVLGIFLFFDLSWFSYNKIVVLGTPYFLATSAIGFWDLYTSSTQTFWSGRYTCTNGYTK